MVKLKCHDLLSWWILLLLNCWWEHVLLFLWAQILGIQEDGTARSEAHCRACRWVQKWHIELDWFLLCCHGVTYQPHGRTVQEADDSRQTQGRGLLLLEPTRVFARRRYFSLVIPACSTVNAQPFRIQNRTLYRIGKDYVVHACCWVGNKRRRPRLFWWTSIWDEGPPPSVRLDTDSWNDSPILFFLFRINRPLCCCLYRWMKIIELIRLVKEGYFFLSSNGSSMWCKHTVTVVKSCSSVTLGWLTLRRRFELHPWRLFLKCTATLLFLIEQYLCRDVNPLYFRTFLFHHADLNLDNC